MGSYKGIRLAQGMPLRGQRTHTNASTANKLLKQQVGDKLRAFIAKRPDSSRKKPGRK